MTGEVLDEFSQLIATALGLVVALAYNTAIRDLFDKVFGEAGARLAGQFLYATLITIVVSRAAERTKKPRKSEAQGVKRSRGVSRSAAI